MTTARSRVVAATRERIWHIVGDPWHEPRWRPRVQRVEAARFAPWMIRRAMRRQLDAALDGLAAVEGLD